MTSSPPHDSSLLVKEMDNNIESSEEINGPPLKPTGARGSFASSRSLTGLELNAASSFMNSSMDSASFYLSDMRDTTQPIEMSKKTHRLFMKYFGEFSREVLCGSFPCAMLKKECWIGRLYYTDSHLCFQGRFGKKVAKVAIVWSDVIRMHRRALKPMETNGNQHDAILVMSVCSKYTFLPPSSTDRAYNDLLHTWNIRLKSMTSIQNVSVPHHSAELPQRVATLLRDDALPPPPSKDVTQRLETSDHPFFPLETTTSLGRKSQSLNDGAELITVSGVSVITHPGTATPSSVTPIPMSISGGSIYATLPRTAVKASYLASQKKSLKHTDEIREKEDEEVFDEDQADDDKAEAEAHADAEAKKDTIVKRSVTTRGPYVVSPVEHLRGEDSLPKHTLSSQQQTEDDDTGAIFPIICSCASHLKHVVFQETLPVDMQTFWAMMYSSNPTVFKEVHQASDTVDMVLQPWQDKVRTLKYRVTYSLPFKGKSFADCTEMQTLILREKHHLVVESAIETPGVPFGDSFSPYTKLCALQVSAHQLLLTISLKVEFARKLFLESKIEAGAVSNSVKFWKRIAASLKQMPPLTYQDSVETFAPPAQRSTGLSTLTKRLPPSSKNNGRSARPRARSSEADTPVGPAQPSQTVATRKRDMSSVTSLVFPLLELAQSGLDLLAHAKQSLQQKMISTGSPFKHLGVLLLCFTLLNAAYLTYLLSRTTALVMPPTVHANPPSSHPAIDHWLQSISQRLTLLQNEINDVQMFLKSNQLSTS